MKKVFYLELKSNKGKLCLKILWKTDKEEQMGKFIFIMFILKKKNAKN